MVQWQRRKRWSLPSLIARPLDRTRVRMSVGTGSRGEPRVLSPSPHLLFIALRDGGPPARRTARCPRSGRELGSDSVVGPNRVEINLTRRPAAERRQLHGAHATLVPRVRRADPPGQGFHRSIYSRCRRLASALARRSVGHGSTVRPPSLAPSLPLPLSVCLRSSSFAVTNYTYF